MSTDWCSVGRMGLASDTTMMSAPGMARGMFLPIMQRVYAPMSRTHTAQRYVLTSWLYEIDTARLRCMPDWDDQLHAFCSDDHIMPTWSIG